eukprot:2306496-Prymnesium_polylepis.2
MAVAAVGAKLVRRGAVPLDECTGGDAKQTCAVVFTYVVRSEMYYLVVLYTVKHCTSACCDGAYRGCAGR